MKTLTHQELVKAIDFIVKYDVEGIESNGRGIYNTLYYGCPAYKDFKQEDIEEFLKDNDNLTIKNLIK